MHSSGRSQGGSEIIAYHTRQAFHPDDDLTPEEANRIGMELALAFTMGSILLWSVPTSIKSHS
jgi:hypothetical protein